MLIRMPDKVRDKELPLNRAIISDIILWVILSLVLAFGVYYAMFRLPEKRGQHFTLHFKDANEITRGSTVRMMGTEIGYVSNLRIRPDHVEVTIQTYPNALPIPSGATFTILFTGIAGGKSIEIELPDIPRPPVQGKPVYIVEEPIRMKDTTDSTIEITQALQRGAENIADFFGKKKPVEELQYNIRQTHQWMNASVTFTDELDRQILALQNDLAESTRVGIDTLGGLKTRAGNAVSLTAPQRLRPKIFGVFEGMRQYGRLFSAQTQSTVQTVTLSDRLARVNAVNSQLSGWVQKSRTSVEHFPFAQYLDRFDTGYGRFEAFLNRADAMLSRDPTQEIRNFRRSVQGFNRQLESLDTRLQKDPAPKSGPSVPNSGTLQKTQSIAIADRHGRPVTTVQSRWWEQPTAPRQAAPEAEPVKAPSGLRGFVARLGQFFGTVWDALRSLF